MFHNNKKRLPRKYWPKEKKIYLKHSSLQSQGHCKVWIRQTFYGSPERQNQNQSKTAVVFFKDMLLFSR